MIKRIQHIAPLQLGIVLAVLYGILSIIIAVPLFLVFALVQPHNMTFTPGSGPVIMPPAPGAFPFGGIVLVILLPDFYATGGFIGGVIAAAIYNVVARFTGGIEFTLADAPA